MQSHRHVEILQLWDLRQDPIWSNKLEYFQNFYRFNFDNLYIYCGMIFEKKIAKFLRNQLIW